MKKQEPVKVYSRRPCKFLVKDMETGECVKDIRAELGRGKAARMPSFEAAYGAAVWVSELTGQKFAAFNKDAPKVPLGSISESHKETAARIMQAEALVDQAKSAMVTHVGLCAHYNLNPSDGSCEGCPSFSEKTCSIRMFLAGTGCSNAWKAVLS